MGCSWTADGVPTLACLGQVIVRVIGALFLFLGAVGVALFIYGGLRFILSSGDPKGVAAAKNTLTYALIGIALVLSSFAILAFLNTFLNLPTGTLLQFNLGQ